MSGRFINPLPQFSDATPTMYAGAKLFFYATGTSTKQNTYTTKALSVANPNPVVLNSAGRLPNDVFLQDLEYKVVLAPSTDSDPPSSPIWTADPVSHRDQGLVAKTVTGSGSPNGVVAGTAGSASILPDFYWDYTNAILYVCTTTGNAAAAAWTSINASSSGAVPPPQGYLTLTPGLPIIATDVSAATAVYYTPHVGNQVPIYNGSSFTPTTFAELTLTLVASHAASNIYDVFVFSNAGVLTLVTGPSWTGGTSGSITAGSCARGTGAGGTSLSRVNGLYTNAVQITGRNGATTYTINANLATYLGSIFMDGTNGQISNLLTTGQSRKWGAWNAFNREVTTLSATDSTSSWTTAPTTWRQSRGDATNFITAFQGLPIGRVDVAFTQVVQQAYSSSTPSVNIGIGLNSTTVASGKLGFASVGNNTTVGTHIVDLKAFYTLLPVLGINKLNMLEQATTGTTANTFEGSNDMLMTATWAV